MTPIGRAANLTVGILFAVLYFTAIALLVGREGNAYRLDLKQRRAAPPSSTGNPADHVGDSTPTGSLTEPVKIGLAGSAASSIDRSVLADPPDAPPRSWEGEPPGEPRRNPARTEPRPPGITESRLVPTVARRGTNQTKTNGPPLATPKLVVDPRPPDLSGLAPESLRGIGEELYKLINAGHAVVDDPSAISRLERLARALEESGTSGGSLPRFHVLDSETVNAFSHIGDHIYVSRGIFSLAQVDAELQFVIAHELAHLRLGHPAARLEQVARGPQARAGLAPWLHHMIALGYSDDQEFAADAWAYQALDRAGRSRREALGFLRRYRTYSEEVRPSGDGHRPPQSQPGDARQDLDNHYPAHAPVGERLKRLQAEKPPK